MKQYYLPKTLIFLLSGFMAFSAYSQVTTRCMVAHYNLDNDATDSYGSLDGTAKGPSPTTDRFGRPNHAMWFDGDSDMVRLGTDVDFRARTISLWFKADTFFQNGNFGLVFSTDNKNLKYGGTGLSVFQDAGVNQFNCGVGANLKGRKNLQINTWYHFALTVDAAMLRFFFNGVQIDSLSNNNTSHSNDGDNFAHLGCSRNYAQFFKGAIDDVKIYDCALTGQEMMTIYKLSTPVTQYAGPLFSVYPNPVADKLQIEVDGSGIFGTLSILNAQGQLLIKQYVDSPSSEIDLGTLPSGIYILQYTNQYGSSVIKVSK